MARLYKCYSDYCYNNNLKYPIEEMTKISGKNYCSNCANKIKEEKESREKLIKWLSNYLHRYPDGYSLRKIKEFHDERNYSYHDQLLALRYFTEVEHNYLKGVGIIPYVIDEAINFYKKKEINTQVKEKDMGNYKVTFKQEKKDLDLEDFDFELDEEFSENNF